MDDLRIYRALKTYQLMQLGKPAVEIIAERLRVEKLLDEFGNNPSSAPYHGSYHSYCVALNCYEGAFHEKLSEDDARVLFVAALWHDYGHSHGIFKDDTNNISIATGGLVLANAAWKELSDAELEQAMSIIRVTKYPYERDPVTMSEQIIRDADLMQAYEQDALVLRHQYQGLKREIEKMRNVTFTDQEFAEGQRAWLDANVTWHSSWAQHKAVAWERTKQRLFEIMSGA